MQGGIIGLSGKESLMINKKRVVVDRTEFSETLGFL